MMQSNLKNNDENSNAIVLRFVNKKFQNRPLYGSFSESTTLFEVKKYLSRFFSKNTKNRISGFQLVREGPPEDDNNDTIPNNYFDDAYNDMKIGEFKKLIDDNHIYNDLIYFRAILTNEEIGGDQSKTD